MSLVTFPERIVACKTLYPWGWVHGSEVVPSRIALSLMQNLCRITIDATPTLLRSAGVKTYIYHWLVHLRQLASPTERIAAFPFLDSLGNLSHLSSTLGRKQEPRCGD